MLKQFFFGMLLGAFTVAALAQTSVEKAVRFQVVQNQAVNTENSDLLQVSNLKSLQEDLHFLLNKSASQLDELGSRYAFGKSASQLDELGSRYAFGKSASQLDELGSRYAFGKSASQLDELGSRYAFGKSASQLDELGSRYAFGK